MKIKRNIDLVAVLKKKSVLLLGPRGTGKSFYIRSQLENCLVINLLKSKEFLALSNNPSLLEEMIIDSNQIVVIDEIQKIPKLMDEVHWLIEEKNIKFLLTGSSARKLTANSTNLLAGRAWLARMFPFNWVELQNANKTSTLNLKKILQFGTLPAVWTSTDPLENLDNYIQTYIEAELKAEGIIRKIPEFIRFLKQAALQSGELLVFQNVASDAGIPVSTVKQHYAILEETMIGFNLEPWLESKKRKAIGTGKFYFFDTGVLNVISENKPENENSPVWGNRFEHFIINEVRCANFYLRLKKKIYYWRSTSNFEVDLIFGKTAIEIKSTRKVSDKHLSGLKALREENHFEKFIIVSQDPIERIRDGIIHMNYVAFLKKLWLNKIDES